MLAVPPGPDHLAYALLGKQLKSDIIYLEMLGLKIVVLNSAQHAAELLEKRSALYSDRACPPMVGDPGLLDWSGFVAMVGYNDVWRHQRRMMNKWFSIRSVSQFSEAQEHDSKLLLSRLISVLDDPNPFNEVKRQILFATSSSMFKSAYGYRLKGDQDPFFTRIFQATHYIFAASMYPNFLVNLFPILSHVPSWLPGAQWKRDVQAWRSTKELAMNEPFEWTKAQVASGSFEPSILSALLQDHALTAGLPNDERDRRLKELASILLIGSTDTTSAAMINFIAAMVTNPHIQAKAQAEIDNLLGYATRLPAMSDQDQLPYVRNLITELLRWRPVTPTGGAPHVCFQDNTYRGYDIEKGTIVIGNAWAMSRDERVYEAPEEFNPDRFSDPNVPALPGFGWGRRKCPGMHFAEASLFIVIASLLTTYNFSKKKDKDGNEVNPRIEDAPNALAIYLLVFKKDLMPFDFEFKLRSEGHRKLIVESVQNYE